MARPGWQEDGVDEGEDVETHKRREGSGGDWRRPRPSTARGRVKTARTRPWGRGEGITPGLRAAAGLPRPALPRPRPAPRLPERPRPEPSSGIPGNPGGRLGAQGPSPRLSTCLTSPWPCPSPGICWAPGGAARLLKPNCPAGINYTQVIVIVTPGSRLGSEFA